MAALSALRFYCRAHQGAKGWVETQPAASCVLELQAGIRKSKGICISSFFKDHLVEGTLIFLSSGAFFLLEVSRSVHSARKPEPGSNTNSWVQNPAKMNPSISVAARAHPPKLCFPGRDSRTPHVVLYNSIWAPGIYWRFSPDCSFGDKIFYQLRPLSLPR